MRLMEREGQGKERCKHIDLRSTANSPSSDEAERLLETLRVKCIGYDAHMVTGSTAILAASDIQATVTYYKEVLGFQSGWVYDPPEFGGVDWGSIGIMFNLLPKSNQVEGHQHWIDVDNVDQIYAEHTKRGAEIISPIQDKPWGRREYTVRDINGYHLRFAGKPGYDSKGTGVLPQGVSTERRLPTQTEFDRVAGAAFSLKEGRPGVLERSWSGVVALNAEGEAIGVLRIMYDAPGWFSVWDVAVLPDWQGQRVGTKMMETAIELVREESPGAFMFLFTFKDQFYERLGFGKQSLHLLKV